MLARKALAGTAGAPKEYVEDVFSTYLWDGNATARNIVNGIDLSGEGGMVWTKYRNTTNNHRLYDTARGATKEIYTSLTNAESTASQSLTAFNADGFSLGTGQPNENTATVVGWTFRKAKKFFDVVTYTGNGTARTISHNLGSVPGCIIVKRTDTTGAWQVYHRANTAAPETDYLVLNTDAATADSDTRWNDTLPTSTEFSLGTDATVNANSGTYVAYLFAHDAGGFGDAGSDNVISCGGFTYNDTSGNTVNLGFEPQFVLVKNASATGSWVIQDSMRGMTADNTGNRLFPNSSLAEDTSGYIGITSTGFKVGASIFTNGSTIIYIAIRRGPMKTPTSGTDVYKPISYTGNGSTRSYSVGFPIDLSINMNRDETGDSPTWNDRLRGSRDLYSSSTQAETTTSESARVQFDNQTNIIVPNYRITNAIKYIDWVFRRAPGFFDVVCYTGTGSNRTVSHNLGVAPELMIVKRRSTSEEWAVYFGEATKYLALNSTAASATALRFWNDTSPTSSVFTVGDGTWVNTSSATYVAYLFASVNGVSKVGSYTGNGSSQTINCGFTAGARFILIKRTDSTGDWYVYDSARGIVSGNDPQLKLNSTAAEATGYDAVDPDNSGFIVNNDATNFPINVNNATYIFLAIA